MYKKTHILLILLFINISFAKFEINNDLDNLKFDFNNKFHYIEGIVLPILFNQKIDNIWISAGCGLAVLEIYELWDGFKPWSSDFKYNPNQSKFINEQRKRWLYSNKFSLQDALIWNLGGVMTSIFVMKLWENRSFFIGIHKNSLIIEYNFSKLPFQF